MQQRIEAVNGTTTKTASWGDMDQMGHVLDETSYAFAETEEDNVIFRVETDVKDGFWRYVAAEGQY